MARPVRTRRGIVGVEIEGTKGSARAEAVDSFLLKTKVSQRSYLVPDVARLLRTRRIIVGVELETMAHKVYIYYYANIFCLCEYN